MDATDLDVFYMRRCLQLATNGLGRVRPNPLVGCVVVGSDGSVISEGFHQEYGCNHAERNALLRKGDFRGATLYVNLEPCSHFGKTPPCADLIVEKGIRRVVCCNDDPNPLVCGNGFGKLEAVGIEVVRHVLEEEGRWLNRRFFTFMEKQRPYVILKWAESADGYMAPNTRDSYWLSSRQQNRVNHRWRTEEAAILVGSGTFLCDHPSLTARHYYGLHPQSVVLDRRGRLNDVPANWMHLHTQTVAETLQVLYNSKLQSVIVEGGREVLDSFIDSGLYDEVRVLRSSQILGGGLKAPVLPPSASDRITIIDP